MDILAGDPRFPRFVALLVGFLLVVLWLRAQPEWLLVVLPVFALAFLGFDRLADGSASLVSSGEGARLAVGALLMAGPAFAVGFALGRRVRRPDQDVARAPIEVSQTPTEETVALPRTEPTIRP